MRIVTIAASFFALSVAPSAFGVPTTHKWDVRGLFGTSLEEIGLKITNKGWDELTISELSVIAKADLERVEGEIVGQLRDAYRGIVTADVGNAHQPHDVDIVKAYAKQGSEEAKAWLNAHAKANPGQHQILDFLGTLPKSRGAPSKGEIAVGLVGSGLAIIGVGSILSAIIGASGGGVDGQFLSETNKEKITTYMQENPEKADKVLEGIKTQEGMSKGEVEYFTQVAKDIRSKDESDLD
ncbi:hypothetical protein FRB99_007166 [Tulasnella sp. 403]|nr:hypothetical protein FRB99_007166 [Tulasnella sp. 403]